MPIVIEDGSNVTGANSYVTIAEFKAYALDRGITVSSTDAQISAFLILSKDYLESFRSNYKGEKTYSDQALQWPRTYVYIDGYEQPYDEIPELLKSAQSQLSLDQFNGIELQATETGKFVIVQQVGPIRREFSEQLRTSGTPRLVAFKNLLDPLLNRNLMSATVIRA